MAIKIINDIPDASVVKRTVCRNCGAGLEYTPADTYKRVETDYTGGKDTYICINCPKCSNKITVGY